MPFIPKTWVDDQIVYATDMNRIEQGIAEADALLPELQEKANPNLLDNWYFGNPVNQRGQAEYTEAGYTIDRWKFAAGGGVARKTDGGIFFGSGTQTYAYVNNPLEVSLINSLNGKVCTLSALTVDGNLYTTSGVWGVASLIASLGGENQIYSNPSESGVNLRVDATGVTLAAVKLELGTTQTLAHPDADGNWVLNAIPNFSEEFLKCIQSTADASDTYANKVIYHTGNKPTPADIGAAPAGFGLGTSSRVINTDWNEAILNGWWRDESDSVLNRPFPGPWAIGFTANYSEESHTIQTAYYIESDGEVYQKVRGRDGRTGTWGQWEWVNPPMQLGVEYRTTERYLGKPVYKQAVDFGKLPNAKTKNVIYSMDSNVVGIAVESILDETNKREFLGDTAYIKGYLLSTKVNRAEIQIETSADGSNHSVTVVVKYYKTTD